MNCALKTLRVALGIALGVASAMVSTLARGDEAPDFSGAELYRHFCASCHGLEGRGDGPVAASLKPDVPDLTRISARNDGAFPSESVRLTIDGQDLPRAHGVRDMPVWGWEFYAVKGEDPARRQRVEELILRIVEHLRSIQVR
jgi:mono/diheme cytochrome c family protein